MPNEQNKSGFLELEPLPYKDDALAPHISSQTLGIHYGKHHKTYVDNLNKLVDGTELAGLTLADVVKKSAGNSKNIAIFNNAAQVWNHAFYWKSMRPSGGGVPRGDLGDCIAENFGDFTSLKSELTTAALTQFGSGWAWLAIDRGRLVVLKTANADTPIAHGMTPLVTIDVWEHAYYLDYQNRRADYVATYLDKLVNWDFAAENLAKAKA